MTALMAPWLAHLMFVAGGIGVVVGLVAAIYGAGHHAGSAGGKVAAAKAELAAADLALARTKAMVAAGNGAPHSGSQLDGALLDPKRPV